MIKRKSDNQIKAPILFIAIFCTMAVLIITIVEVFFKHTTPVSNDVKSSLKFDLSGVAGLEGCTLYKLYTTAGSESVMRCVDKK
jgi:hypothetical protein